MIFTPRHIVNVWQDAHMWDTWLYFHDGRHYLFYLFMTHVGNGAAGIGVALSDDGVHYVDQGPILHKDDNAEWMGTGMTWRVGDTFLLNFSEGHNGVQEIFFAESDDLLHWRRLPNDEYVCRQDSRWYADAPIFTNQRWDCIWVLPREGGDGYIGFLTAVARVGPPGLCGTAGCVLSDDGRHFHAAPPAIEPGTWGDRVEVGAVERIGDRYYMLLGALSRGLGSRYTPDDSEAGMWVLTAERQEGPYRRQDGQAMLIGSSPNRYTYFARFYRCGDDLLVNHHMVPRASWGGSQFTPLKRAHRDDHGLLSLRWWPGNEAIKGQSYPSALDSCVLYGLLQNECDLQMDQLRLSAAAGGVAILPRWYDAARGVVLEATLRLETMNGPLSSLGVFVEGERAHTGTLLLLQSDGYLSVGPYNGYAFTPEDKKPFRLVIAVATQWRLLLRGAYLELYIDETLIQCYTLAHPVGRRVGFALEAGSMTVEDVRTWEMSF